MHQKCVFVQSHGILKMLCVIFISVCLLHIEDIYWRFVILKWDAVRILTVMSIIMCCYVYSYVLLLWIAQFIPYANFNNISAHPYIQTAWCNPFLCNPPRLFYSSSLFVPVLLPFLKLSITSTVHYWTQFLSFELPVARMPVYHGGSKYLNIKSSLSWSFFM